MNRNQRFNGKKKFNSKSSKFKKFNSNKFTNKRSSFNNMKKSNNKHNKDKKQKKKYFNTKNFFGNAYRDNQGNYKEKPFFANFFKVGFLDDVPTRADYNREMDGIKYTDSVIPRENYETEEEWLKAIQTEDHDHLYGLERAQISLMRLWNGAPREWIKLIVRIGIVLLGIATYRLIIDWISVHGLLLPSLLR